MMVTMPKKISQDEANLIADIVAKHRDGVGLAELYQTAKDRIPHLANRTLQRRLAQMVAEKRIVRTGQKRGTRYRITAITGSLNGLIPVPVARITAEAYVPLSAEGAEIRVYVRQPINQRAPLGYKIEFLEHYIPNNTFYLPQSLRQELLVMGQPRTANEPAGTFARDILNRLLIDLSWASSRLEGNTYTRLDTEQLITLGQAAEGKDATETQMILNHKAAIEYMFNHADVIDINRPTILSLHALLSDGLLRDPSAGGRVRTIAVDIGGSVYRPLALPQKLDELFGHVLDIGREIEDPFEQAFFLMVHLPYLQPFEDVNKRVSRLAANVPLLKGNLCPLSFVDVPEQAYDDAVIGVYELNRTELLRDVFVWAYERSCQQYLAVQQQLVPPDTFRLRYRNALNETVRAIVHGGHDADYAHIAAAVPASVDAVDQARFINLVSQEFAHIHAGNAVRYGVGALKFEAWRNARLG